MLIRDLVLVCSLKGAFVFTADLARAIGIPMRIEFIRAESYGEACDGFFGLGLRIREVTDLALDGRDLLLVEDIIDTGRTSARLLEVLQAHKPREPEIGRFAF